MVFKYYFLSQHSYTENLSYKRILFSLYTDKDVK